MQTGYPVDDVCVVTHDGGFIVVQAKTNLRLEATEGSPLAQALAQAVRMYREGIPYDTTEPGSGRAWNATVDRIVIATDHAAPATVRHALVTVVDRLATAPGWSDERQLVDNNGQQAALDVFKKHVDRLWRQEAGAEITREEFREFCAVLRLMVFDLEPGGRDLLSVHALLAGALVDRSRIQSAWKSLLSECGRLSAGRRFAAAGSLRGNLAVDGIVVNEVEHPGDVWPAFAPEEVLYGPLAAGPLHDRLAEAHRILDSDPHTAAELFARTMTDLHAAGHIHEAATIQSRLSHALHAAGRHETAVRATVTGAWSPLQRGEVPSQFSDEWELVDELRKSPQVRSPAGNAVVAMLQYEAGQASLTDVAVHVAELDQGDEHAGELLLWLAEEAIAAGRPEVFGDLCDRALAHAREAAAEARELAGRLRIAVAECREEWPSLLAVIEADCGGPLYALALARHGQALAKECRLAEAVDSYEKAIERATGEHMYAEIRNWLYDLRNLRHALGGPGTGHETHYTAQSLPQGHKISVFQGEELLLARGLESLTPERYDRARRIFMRLRHRMSAGAALGMQRQCEKNLGAAHASDNPEHAVGCYLRAGESAMAVALVRDQPDAPLIPDRAWLNGPVWQLRATYEFLGAHGDLVPDSHARPVFEELGDRLITTGTVPGWSILAANEALLGPLAALAWASMPTTAARLVDRLAPAARSGRFPRAIKDHVSLLLGCARTHPTLAAEAADQFANLARSSTRALEITSDAMLTSLAPAKELLVKRLSQAAIEGRAPWLIPVLVGLGVQTPDIVEHAKASLDAAAAPRSYQRNSLSFGSDMVSVAQLSPVCDLDRRSRFLTAMLDIALEPREPNLERHEAIDAIVTVVHLCGVNALDPGLRARIGNAIRPLAAGQGVTPDDDPAALQIGSPKELILAANRLLIVLAENDQDQRTLARTLLLTLMDGDIDNPRLLRSALSQAPADTFRHDLLALAVSRSPSIRVFAAQCWTRIPDTDPAIGQRLAADPSGLVRLALAHSLTSTVKGGTDDIRSTLGKDCRASVRAAIQPPLRRCPRQGVPGHTPKCPVPGT
ncbi:hypothetical protein ACQPZF_27390 [Actinosynnema sp. CS-041913]|uniref:hypothetical protein n=1 Tax=Actinosynnema sp. CS-041913 TaxID=3239917 RepID=UPI003D9208BA